MVEINRTFLQNPESIKTPVVIDAKYMTENEVVELALGMRPFNDKLWSGFVDGIRRAFVRIFPYARTSRS